MSKTVNHPNRVYPWEKWFEKGTFTIEKGKHFSCMTHGMVSQIRNYARKRGIEVSVKANESNIVVTVRK